MCPILGDILGDILTKKIYNLNLFMRSINEPKLREAVQNKCTAIFKSIKEGLFQIKESKEAWQLKATCDPGLGHFAIKDIIRATGKS